MFSVLAASVALQLTAAVLALRLVRVTRNKLAWGLIAGGLVLMVGRRVVTLVRALTGDVSHPPDPTAEWIALLISALMVVGIWRIAPLFRAMRRVQERTGELEARAERAVRSKREFRRRGQVLQSILDSIGEGVVVCDTEGSFVHWNPAAERIIGRGPTDADPAAWSDEYGSFMEDRVTPVPEDQHPLMRALHGEDVNGASMYLKRPDLPEGRWLELTARPVMDKAGEEQLGAVVVFKDTTEQRRIAADLEESERRHRELAEELAESNEALRTFASSVSHDVRAPLRAMYGLAEALEEDYAEALDDRGRDYCRRIVGAAAKMDGLIQDLLEYSQLSSEEIRLQPVELDSVVAEVRQQLEPELAERDAEIHIRTPLGTVRGHQATLHQVVANLLTNAVKFTEPGSDPKVTIWSEEQNGRVRLWVEDNGIGIEPDHQDRIFNVFERLHGDDRYPGTGVGLAVVKKAVERLGGAVGVQSEPGEGSRFWLELPPEEMSS